MKKTFLPFALMALMLTGSVSCKKNDNGVVLADDITSARLMAEFFEKYAPQSETFTLDASAGGTLTLSSGTTITFPANAFVKPDGSPVSGNVSVSAKDILTAGDMILAN